MFPIYRLARPALIVRCSHALKSQPVHRAFSISHSRYVDSSLPSQSPSAKIKNQAGEQRSIAERMSLKGKTTVITGGARGIGLALAEAAAEAGSNLAILDVLEKPQRDLSELGVKAEYYRFEMGIRSRIWQGIDRS